MKTELIDRIDTALAQVGMNRNQLSKAIGLSAQALTNLAKREGTTMKPINIAHAARALRCDLYWLCTGEGGDYVPEGDGARHSIITNECVKLLDDMTEDDRMRTYAFLSLMSRGQWPAFTGAAADHLTRTFPPASQERSR